MNSAGQSHIRVRLVGGPPTGRTVLVPATLDSPGREIPGPQVYHWVEYSTVDGRACEQMLNYVLRRLHDGRFVYVLHGLPEKDFDLEELISRLRASWTGVELLSDRQSVPYPRGEMPDDAAQYLERQLFHRLHDLAREQDLMIIEFIGPAWQPGPFQAGTCVLQARCTRRPKA